MRRAFFASPLSLLAAVIGCGTSSISASSSTASSGASGTTAASTGSSGSSGEASSYYCLSCQADSDCGGTDDAAGISSNGNYCLCADSNCTVGFCGTKCESPSGCPETATCESLDQPGSPDFGSVCIPTDEVCPNQSFDAGSVPTSVLVTVPLTGCPIVGYDAPVTIAGQTFQMGVDTGSTDTAVALTTCVTCDVSPEYGPAPGSCSGSTASQYGTSQQNESGWTAEVCSAAVEVGLEMPAVTIDFAGITMQQDFFLQEDCSLSTAQSAAQGILGLGPLDLSTLDGGPDAGDRPVSDDSYFTELVAQGVTDTLALLLCSENGGMLWFGGYDAQYASGTAQYTPLTNSGYWSVSLSSIGLGTQDLGGADANALIDSGTGSFLMSRSALGALANALAADSSAASIFGPGRLGSGFFGNQRGIGCIAPAGGQSQAEIDAALPPLTLTFPSTSGGAFTLSLPASQSYLVPVSSGGQTEYCAGASAGAANASQGPTTVIGAPALRANITVLDEGGGQVGFAPQSYCQ